METKKIFLTFGLVFFTTTIAFAMDSDFEGMNLEQNPTPQQEMIRAYRNLLVNRRHLLAGPHNTQPARIALAQEFETLGRQAQVIDALLYHNCFKNARTLRR